jgi:excisionase family DNA binding protein
MATTVLALRVDQVAELLQVHPSSVRRLIADGELPAVRIGAAGRAIRVPRSALEQWLHATPREREHSTPSATAQRAGREPDAPDGTGETFGGQRSSAG